MNTARQIVEKSRSRMISNFPFYACILLSQELVETDKVPAMATDGKHIFWNPEWVSKWTVAQVTGVFAHECEHIAYCHPIRKIAAGLEHNLFNVACDYAINGGLIKAGFELPPDGLIDSRFDGWSAEKIYFQLLRERPAPQPSDGPSEEDGESEDNQGSGQSALDDDTTGLNNAAVGTGEPQAPVWGQVLDAVNDDGNVLDEVEQSEARAKVAELVQSAAQVEKKVGKGKSDANVRNILGSLKGEPKPWFEIIQDYLTEARVVDESYDNCDRRFIHQGMILPSDVTEPNGEIVIPVDTSCSLSDEELSEISGHVRDIVDLIDPSRVHVVYCDSSIRKTVTYERGDFIKLKFYGGGGTAFNPPFNWVQQQDIVPDCMIYFTDGYGDVGPEGYKAGADFEVPSYPVIWATSGREPWFVGCEPFGEVVEI